MKLLVTWQITASEKKQHICKLIHLPIHFDLSGKMLRSVTDFEHRAGNIMTGRAG